MHPLRSTLVVVFLSALFFPGGLVRADEPAKVKQTKWLNLYDAAIIAARKQDKTILAYFSGSDWCPYCQKLEKDVLNTPMFQEWATKNVVLLQIDYPKDKKLIGNIKIQN